VDVFVLSDTRSDATAAREQMLFAAWQATDSRALRLHYRRRARNDGFKAGNLRDFCDQWGAAYDFMIVLDADSVMTGAAMLRLMRLMQANPRLGILQSMVVGLPSQSAFARLFQFGMRHGMRAYTFGSAWWQGDCGPYWGHNAIIRMQPFIHHCRLPRLPGPPPLGGVVLSHDQVEAALMRRAGYEVRVLPIEDGSFEANPTTLPEYVRRDLRWCLGNMQYIKLLRRLDLHRLGRLQLWLAILMYLSAPAWMLSLAIGAITLLVGPSLPALMLAPGGGRALGLTQAQLGIILFITIIVIAMAPKLLGQTHALLVARERRAFGGGRRLLAGIGAELVAGQLLIPIIAVAHSRFLLTLLLGGSTSWTAQVRGTHAVPWGEAIRRYHLQTALGLSYALMLLATAPALLAWAAPLIAGLCLAAPFAVVTASQVLGATLARWRLAATPEELAPPPEVLRVCPWLPSATANAAAHRQGEPAAAAQSSSFNRAGTILLALWRRRSR
jgi:membrane glycosyltransferase